MGKVTPFTLVAFVVTVAVARDSRATCNNNAFADACQNSMLTDTSNGYITAGVYGEDDNTGTAGVWGISGSGWGVMAQTTTGWAVYATATGTDGIGGYFSSTDSNALVATAATDAIISTYTGTGGSNAIKGQTSTGSSSSTGVYGVNTGSSGGIGVKGTSSDGYGGYFASSTAVGLYVTAPSNGIVSYSTGTGGQSAVYANATYQGNGVYGVISGSNQNNTAAIYGNDATSGDSNVHWAGYFNGNVRITGNLEFGTGSNTCGPYGGSYSCPSDERLKKNVEPLQSAVGQLLKLKGVTFDWRDPTQHGSQTGRQTGFIAQDVQRVFPEWVKEDGWKAPDGKTYRTLGVPLVQVTALEVEAIRSQQAEIEILKEQVRALANGEHPHIGGFRFPINELGWGVAGILGTSLFFMSRRKRGQQAA
jgi:hypothetical protein